MRKLGQTVTKLETASRDLARYHLLFENAFDPTLFLTHDLRILEANPPAAARYGYSREGLVGLSVNTLRSSGADPESDGLLAEALTRPIVYETERRECAGRHPSGPDDTARAGENPQEDGR